jgi:LytS/YehU family sensor histidine kinase
LYYLIPQWLKRKNKLAASLFILLVVVLFVILYRAVIQFITWPYFLNYVPELNMQSQVARFFYSFLEILQLLGITAAIRLLRLRAEAARREKEYLREKKSSDLLRLRAQIHPHFLFNMLNTLYFMSSKSSQKTPEVIHKMADLLRFMLYESEKKLVTLESELRIVDEYIVLQQLRFDNKMHIESSTDIDQPQAAIAPLLIFPLVENAFKHGVGSRSDNSFINIRTSLKKNQLNIHIRNSVMAHSVKEKGHGIGQANIKKQLEILYTDFSFSHEEKDKEYSVNLSINLNSYVDFELFDH